MLRKVLITSDREEYAQITNLLPSIFPKEELPPPHIIDEVIPYLCFYEDDTLIGFAQVLKRPELHYLRYMAMLPQYRSKGFGGKMLDLILQERGNVPLALDIEPLDEKSDNYEQRLRRFRFYQKHGMADSGYLFIFGDSSFSIITTGEETVPLIMQKLCAKDSRYAPGFIRIVKRVS